jgi:hypothetical protein
MLQGGKSRVRNPIMTLHFFDAPNHSSLSRPGVYSASNINEYQKQKINVSGE